MRLGREHEYTTFNKLPYPTSPYKDCLPPMSTLQKAAGSVHHRGSAEGERKQDMHFVSLLSTIQIQ